MYDFEKTSLRKINNRTDDINLNLNNNQNHNNYSNQINNNNNIILNNSQFKKTAMNNLSLSSSSNNTATTTTTIALPTSTMQQQQSQSQQSQCLNSNNTTAATICSNNSAADDISGGVQDTIYLCNFRVSVDGEWLCLKELQDLDIQDNNVGGNKMAQSSYDSGNAGNMTKITAATSSIGQNHQYQHLTNFDRDPASIERSNLVNICKLIVKELLEQSIRYGRMLDSDHLPLQHFFIVLEHVLRHGLRPKKGLLGPKKELWDLLQCVEKYCIEAHDITVSVRDLPTVRTHIGRARAWLRIALMQKKLSDYLQSLIEHKDEILFEYYEPHALMMSDEVVVIMGILVGLNVIDFNLCVKEEDLDSQQGVIDFSLYLRTSSSRQSLEDDSSNNMIDTTEGNMTTVLDQKNYIEELNRHLNATVTNLQAKVESLTTTNALMKEDLAIARNSLLTLQAENQALRLNLQNKLQNFNNNQQQQQITQPTTNLENSNETQQHQQQQQHNKILSSNDSDALINELKKKNNELEKELRLQVSLKAETDMAMKLLEKDIHEKQDTIISLRRQLEDIKQINLEMYKKLQECESSLRHKTELLTKLESQKDDMANAILQLEKQLALEKQNYTTLQETSKTLSYQLNATEEKAARSEAEIRIEREWRLSLQDKETKLKEQINNLQSHIKQLNFEFENMKKIKNEYEQLKKQWLEAQTTLEEMGIQLSVSKLKLSEYQEKLQQYEKYNSKTTTTSKQNPNV